MINQRTGRSHRIRQQNTLPIERLPLACIVIDRKHRVSDWNPAAEHIFGYTKQEALGKNCLDLLLPSSLTKHVQEVVHRVWKGDLNAHSVNENLTKDGRTITCEWSNTPIRDPRGEVRRVLCLGRDITASKSAEQMLETTQRRYQAIFQYALGAIFLWDDLGHLVDGNPSACELTGFSQEELVTLHVFDLIPKADRAKVSGVLREFRSSGTMSGEGLLLRRDGETRNVEYRAVASILEGLHLGVLCDVTESRRANEELKLQADILQTAFDHIPVMIKFVDRNRPLQFVNQHLDKILNRSEAKPQSIHSTAECGSADDFPRVRLQRHEPNISARSTTKTTFKAKSSDGRMLDISWVNVTLSNGNCISFGQDITEQCQAKNHLRESEERFRQLAENIDGYFWLNSLDDERLYYLSQGYERICGRSCESVYQRPYSWTDNVHPDDRERVLAESREPLNDQGRQLEYRIVRPDGTIRWVRDRAFPVRDASGQVSCAARIGEDITERKQSESALHESAARLQELSRRVVEVQEQEHRRLARELHDEIGQVLSTIRFNLSANMEDSNCTTRTQLEESVSIVDEAIQQVHDLSLALRPSMIDDLGLVATLRWSAERQAKRANFKLKFVAKSTAERLSADLEIACYRLAQEALTNIVRHARARNVSFEFCQRYHEVTIVICDDGAGFEVTDVQQRIARGASLGVRGMRERAELLGGKFDISSSPGTGTTIRVQLPFEH